ncbi:MAG: hypothetical protein ACI4XE_02725 [Acutalibacteraceae bacterium]
MNEYLNDALNEISDEKIAEAVKEKKTKRLTFWKAASAACLVLAVAAAVVLANTDKLKVKDEKTEYQADAVTSAAANVGGGETVPGGAEVYVEKKWNEKENNEKYSELNFDGETYITTGMKAQKTEVGEKLGTAKAKGFDIYTDKNHETDCEVYAIGTFKSELLVAVKFGSDDNLYAYKAENYFPSDLRNFTDTLGFFENIRFDSDVILSSDFNTDAQQVKLNDSEAVVRAVCELLQNNGSAEALEYTQKNSSKDGERVLEFGVSSPLLSRYSLFLSVSEDGYIMTNLVDVGVSFFVGRDAVKTLFETADKTGGEKYVQTTTPPYPTESEPSTVYKTTVRVSQSIDEYEEDGVCVIDTIEVTEVYSETSQAAQREE